MRRLGPTPETIAAGDDLTAAWAANWEAARAVTRTRTERFCACLDWETDHAAGDPGRCRRCRTCHAFTVAGRGERPAGGGGRAGSG